MFLPRNKIDALICTKILDMSKFENIDFNGKKALIRVDFNVPLDDNLKVTDASRIEAAIPTIQRILNNNGSVVLMSHLGRPKGVGYEEKYSLKPVAAHLSGMLGKEVIMGSDSIGAEVLEKISSMPNGGVLMLENLRFYNEEVNGDEWFAEQLAKNGDIYINDAFGTAHRAHASTSIIAKYFDTKSKCFGYLMDAEVSSLNKALSKGEKPICAVVGGAKVSSKIDVLTNLVSKVDKIIIGGGMAYTFVKALGGRVGNSLVEDDKISVAKELMNSALDQGVEILLPIDSVNNSTFADNTPTSITPVIAIPNGEMGLDIGQKTVELYTDALMASKTIIWNGPMGVFEFENYQNGTVKIGEAIARSTENGAFSLVGGGDSVAAVKKFHLEDRVSYVSTGGGAMLEFLEGKILPGIDAMEAN